MEEQNKSYSEKAEFYKKEIEQTIENIKDSLIGFANPFGDINDYNKGKEQFKISKEKLERIVKKDNLTEEEEYFIYKELNLDEIFSKYHEEALYILGYSLEAFYFLRDSEASGALDSSVLLTKILKVPNSKYIDKVLEKTPKEDQQVEFEDQLKERELSKEDTDFLLYKYNLKIPEKLLPITEDYKREVRSKKDLLSLLEKFGLRK